MLRMQASALLLVLLLLPAIASAQSMNATISGTITDATHAVVPGADVSLTNIASNVTVRTVSGTDGLFSFPNLSPGTYELRVKATGFKPVVQRPLEVSVSQLLRTDIVLEIGTDVQSIEVQATAPLLNFDNAAKTEGVESATINELPLAVGGSFRTVANYLVLLPGITTGSGNDAYDARINGGLVSGDEAIMDGASMQEGFMSQSGMVSFYDFRFTPDMVQEFQVKTSSYEPEYGATTGGQIIATTKSGTAQFHGAAYEYLRNKALNATQWQTGREPGDVRPKDNENNFGFAIGGPAKIPKIYNTDRMRTFFYFVYERYFQRGGASVPTLTVPTEKMRNGDFSEWPEPIYDPRTTRLNPNFDSNQDVSASNPRYLRDPFQNNIIPQDRIQGSLASGWFKYLPLPNKPGITSNWQAPMAVPDTILGDAREWMLKIDQYVGTKDHIAATVWRQNTPPKFFSVLPVQIASETFSDPQNAWVNRANWDHTFSPTLLNHFTFGYLNRNEGYGSVNYTYADALPQIANVPSHDHPPVVTFGNGYPQMGESTGSNCCGVTTRPTFVYNDILTWVKGRHTIKGGFEYRSIQGNTHNHGNESGTFNFDSGQTGLPTVPGSGNAMASFLLGAVNYGNVGLWPVGAAYSRQHALIFHMGDTWKATSKLSLNYGLRWDFFSPSHEKYDNMTFFDWGPNPEAGNRPGRLAFAGTKWGSASAGVPYPEEDWHGGFGPRLGIAYALNNKTVVRTGYGIFYTQAFYPGWGGGVDQTGLNNGNAEISSTAFGGLDPAFYLQDGFPIDRIAKPPFVDPGFLNGIGAPNYRPKDGNRLSYSQQWNLTIERQLPGNQMVSAAYVGNKGTRLPSQILPINVLNPSLLGPYGSALSQQFTGPDDVIAGVGEPYPGWFDQMTNCSPTLAQALLPFPQYCGSLTGLNENLGSSTYHALQLKWEKRFSQGLYALVSYNRSKILTSSTGVTQSTAAIWNGSTSVINPYEMSRNKALAADDVPNSFSAAAVYDLPFGKGKKFANSLGPANYLIGGWQLTTTVKLASGIPFFFRSATCGVPGQFGAQCIPAVLPGQNPMATDVNSYDPGTGKSLFNSDAFEPVSSFTGVGYWGVGPRVSNYRAQRFENVDIGLGKITNIGEHLRFILRAEAFNAFNMHRFSCAQGYGGCQTFNTSLGDANFGTWNGAVSNPRNIQLVGRIEF